MSLANECMVMNLQISVWMGYKLDKRTTAEVIEQKHAQDGAVRVNKHLIHKDYINPIVAAGGAVRRHFYENTLPWKDNGDRILTRKRYEKFIQRHSELTQVFNEAVEHFLTVAYAQAQGQAEFRMGEMYDPRDYPKAEQLRHMFGVHMDIEPVAEGKDFRVQIGKAEVAKVRSQMDAALEARVHSAKGDLWKRMHTVVKYYHDRMASDTKFKATTVTNLQELVELVPELDFTDDPDIKAVRDLIATGLAVHEPEDLRDSEKLRTKVTHEAEDILKTMGGFMKALGVSND